MEEYLLLLKRRLFRANTQVSNILPDSLRLNAEGFRMLGYYQGRVSILEDAIDEIELYLESK